MVVLCREIDVQINNIKNYSFLDLTGETSDSDDGVMVFAVELFFGKKQV